VKRDTWIVAAVLAGVAGAMLGGSLVCAWAIAHGASMNWRWLFRLFCHGIPRRCLYVWGVPMPICARCTAIYGGALAGIVLFRIGPRLSEFTARMIMFAFAIPMAIDGLTQLTTLRESNNTLRVATGIASGIGFAWWSLTAVERHVAPAVESAGSSS
jgi:uncharacterized membrane protein